MDSKTKETLEKQLELLSERSSKAHDTEELCLLTEALVEVAKVLGLLG